MIVAGIGCRKAASAADIEAAVGAALERADLADDAVDFLATSAQKGNEAGIVAAASVLGLPLVIVPQADLMSASARTVTHSARVLELTGVPSLAEAAALAAAGAGARLLVPRIAVGAATCALAESGDGT